MRVVGVGVGRTGTHSLKLALEQLLGGRCHHMAEVFEALDTVPRWRAAAEGGDVDWDELLGDFVAIVDWPGAACWPELVERYPDAVVLLSTRSDADAWYRSADATIFEATRRVRAAGDPNMADWLGLVDAMCARDDMDWDDEASAKAGYEAHNAAVRASVPAERLVEWQPGDGWGPLCAALGVPEPDEPFPHSNSTSEFRSRSGWD